MNCELPSTNTSGRIRYTWKILLLLLMMMMMMMLQDVVDSHPGLTFLQDAPEFHSRYVQTVSFITLPSD